MYFCSVSAASCLASCKSSCRRRSEESWLTSVFSFEKDGVLKVTVGDTTFNGTYSSEGSELTYNYKVLLKENTDLRDELEYQIREHYNILNGMKKPKVKKCSNDVEIDPETGEVIE